MLTFDNLYLTYEDSSSFALDAQYVDMSGLSGYAHSHSSRVEVTAGLYAYTSDGQVYRVWQATTSGTVNLPRLACSFGTVKTVTKVQFVSLPVQDSTYHDMMGYVSVSIQAPTLEAVACVAVSCIYIYNCKMCLQREREIISHSQKPLITYQVIKDGTRVIKKIISL